LGVKIATSAYYLRSYNLFLAFRVQQRNQRTKMSSRHSGSSRHRSHQSRSSATDGANEDLVDQVKSIASLLYDVVTARPHEWEAYLASARSAMTALDHLRFFRDPTRFAEQVWIIQGLQDYAYHDADSGCIRDVAEYCQSSWLRVLRNYPDNVETLTGKVHPSHHNRLSAISDASYTPVRHRNSAGKPCPSPGAYTREWANIK
jgi:hypothetical protein